MNSLSRTAITFATLSLIAFSSHATDIAGTASATFSNPTPGTVYSGVGTHSFTWGNPSNFGVGPNNLTFSGGAFSSSYDTPFKLGTLSYFNGTTAVGSTATSVKLNTVLAFSQPSGLAAANSSFTLGLNSTPNTGTAAQNADYVNFGNLYSTTNFVIGGVTYTVKITGFGNVIGDGFLASNTQQFHVMEGHRAQADLFGTVTAAVPEPETYAMLLAGLGAIAGLVRRRKAVHA